MKKFRYRLQKILSLKTTLKKQAQKDFAAAESELSRQTNILESIKSELAIRLKNEKQARCEKLDLKQISLTQQYFGQLSFLIKHQIHVVTKSKKTVEDRRRDLLAASKEKRKYERLKEIRKEDYNRELEMALQKETDEFAKNVHRQKAKDF
jgi:flagellar protein FliJ